MKAILSFGCVLMALAIIGTGTAFASIGWGSESDSSNYWPDGSVTWASKITSTGEFTQGELLSWDNYFYVRPECDEDSYGAVFWRYGYPTDYPTGERFYDDILSPGESSPRIVAWGAVQSATGSYQLAVNHRYYDSTKSVFDPSTVNIQTYNVSPP